jgi:V8-like Glu-specific endopeptidase
MPKVCLGVVAVFFMFSPFKGSSQVVTSGRVITSGHVITSGANTGGGTWSDRPRRATLSIGLKRKDEFGKERFLTGGAAVLVTDAANRTFIVTALHVFDNPSEHWAPDSLQVRGWRDEPKGRYEDFGVTLQVRKEGQALFTASKEFDLAIIPAPQAILDLVADDDHKYVAVSPETIAGNDETYDGADVFILGFPGLVGDQYQQRALMRTGIVAWTDSSGPSDHEFLVDARIFPGNSGGPVFSSAGGMTRTAGWETGKAIKLLGIVSQTINAKQELALGHALPKEAMVMGAAGVGVIEPAHALIALMAQVP